MQYSDIVDVVTSCRRRRGCYGGCGRICLARMLAVAWRPGWRHGACVRPGTLHLEDCYCMRSHLHAVKIRRSEHVVMATGVAGGLCRHSSSNVRRRRCSCIRPRLRSIHSFLIHAADFCLKRLTSRRGHFDLHLLFLLAFCSRRLFFAIVNGISLRGTACSSSQSVSGQ